MQNRLNGLKEVPFYFVCCLQSRVPGGISVNIVICCNDVRLSGGSFHSRAVAVSLNLMLPHLYPSSPNPCFPVEEILRDTQNS